MGARALTGEAPARKGPAQAGRQFVNERAVRWYHFGMWLTLDGQGPLGRQLYRALRAAILEGRLPAGARLPSTRALARELGLSRNTALAACERLIAEGYTEVRRGSGSYVRAGSMRPRAEPGAPPPVAPPPRLSRAGQRIAELVPRHGASWRLPQPPVLYDFRYGDPAYGDLPLATWARVVGRRVRALSARQLAYPPPAGLPALRRAVADYLGRSRGVRCVPEQVVIVHGSQQCVDLTVRLLVDAGDAVAIEEPHYFGFAWSLRAAGARLRPVPVDGDGLRVERLERLRGVRLACVTPSHQFPTGAVLTLERRLALLTWAQRANAYILEDDYDGEFRYGARPAEALYSLDRGARVIYAGTASKLLFPGLRIGWLVAPLPLVRAFSDAKALTDAGSATLEQLALAELIQEGHLERHVRRARLRYAARRDALMEALERELGERVSVSGQSAGLHVLIRLKQVRSSELRALDVECRRRGVGIYGANRFYLKPPPRAELLLGFTCLRRTEIREGVRRLRQAVDALKGSAR